MALAIHISVMVLVVMQVLDTPAVCATPVEDPSGISRDPDSRPEVVIFFNKISSTRVVNFSRLFDLASFLTNARVSGGYHRPRWSTLTRTKGSARNVCTGPQNDQQKKKKRDIDRALAPLGHCCSLLVYLQVTFFDTSTSKYVCM